MVKRFLINGIMLTKILGLIFNESSDYTRILYKIKHTNVKAPIQRFNESHYMHPRIVSRRTKTKEERDYIPGDLSSPTYLSLRVVRMQFSGIVSLSLSVPLPRRRLI